MRCRVASGMLWILFAIGFRRLSGLVSCAVALLFWNVLGNIFAHALQVRNSRCKCMALAMLWACCVFPQYQACSFESAAIQALLVVVVVTEAGVHADAAEYVEDASGAVCHR